ncbi:hypothetical protein GCM10022224_065130 [Nonomuraea antimicrobica]|uniref:Uncharacterized protein n=1 Tax=Nonomuraea antimicrobica TaxID=561173 RepID=A0ABP7CKE8_9ACTN
MPDAPLLHYSTSTAPLQAGTPDKPAANTIDITVSSPAGQKIYCKKLDIAVPISAPDDGGAYFTENPQSSITGKWSVASAQVENGRKLGLDPATNYHHVIFQAPPVPGLDLIDQPLKISITGNIAAAPGSELTCPTTETSGTTSGKYTPKSPQDLTWETAEPVFYLHNFLASAPDRPTIPRTKFKAGDEILLTWESNGSEFQLYDGVGATLYEGPATSYTISGSTIVSDTTVTLRASVTTGFEASDRYATITVTITNPTLDDLKVTNKLTTTGSNGLIVNGELIAASNVYAQANLQVNDDATVSGDLTVNGKTNLETLFGMPIQLDPEVSENGQTEEITTEEDGLLIVQNSSNDESDTMIHIMENGKYVLYGLLIGGGRGALTLPLRKGQTWRLLHWFRGKGDIYWTTFR